MAKPELGTKRACPSCGAKFYDLGRRPARCPKCETEFDPELEDAPKKQPDTSDDDGYGDEDDDTPEVDAEADRIPDDDDDDDENSSGLSDDLPDGFEEEDVDDDSDDDDDTSVLLDDEEDDDFGDFNIEKDEDL